MTNCSHGVPFEHTCHLCLEEGLERSAKHKPKSIKAKSCKVCKGKFIPSRAMQSVCAWPADCAQRLAELTRKKKESRELRDYRERSMSLGHRHELTQKDVNAYIVARDRAKGYGCISCGTHNGKPQAGHYLSRGARPGLRYDERNIWLQCYRCNVELSSNAIMYRIELVKRIGAQAVEELEQDYTVKNYTHSDLIELGAHYRKLLRELNK